MTERAVVLVDGEHYPSVIAEAIRALGSRGYEIVGAALLGGGEKLTGALDLGDVPVIEGSSPRDALERALDGWRPDVVIDCSDAPVLDARERALLASVTLARGVAYRGADFAYDPPPRPRLTRRPTVAVIGTGKRTGKTAVSAAFARHLAAAGMRPVIVAMGRGGPARPTVVRGDRARPRPEELLELADRGEHAASDVYEDAVVAGVTAVGARRAGAGLAGAPLVDSVAAAIEVAEAEDPDFVVLEGSGTAIPPAAADATVLVVGGATPVADLTQGLAPYRVLLADLALVTMCEEPVLSTETLSALSSQVNELARDVRIVRTVFRPAPVGRVGGKKVFLTTTAPEAVGPALRKHLEEAHGATVVGISHRLAERAGLSEDLAQAEGTYEVLLTEVKAAAIDVAVRAAVAAGAEVVFADNEPIAIEGVLGDTFDWVERLARDRWEALR